MFRPTIRDLARVALTLTLSSCGGDSTGPGLNFPELSAQVRAENCVQENLTKDDSRSGTISNGDCDSVTGYFESYLLKVATSGQVVIDATSPFDNLLVLLEIQSFTATELNVFLILLDNDSGGGTNARITATLQAGTNYMIVVGGNGSTEIGPYTLMIH